MDGEEIELCVRRDGILGEGRFALFMHSPDGAFSGFGTGRWDTRQGGYSGLLLHSNDTARAGPLLLYKHKEGWLRMRRGTMFLDPRSYPDMVAQHVDLVAAIPPKLACDLLPPPPRRLQKGVPELTGRYFSNFNESLAVCTANGSLVVAFSGLGYLQGFASGVWVPERDRWEGTVAEVGAVRPFWWQRDPTDPSERTLKGIWEPWNRTYTLPVNVTEPPDWEARRDDGEQEELPTALAAPGMSVDHVCALLIAADSGLRESLGDVEDGWLHGAAERDAAAAAGLALGAATPPGAGWSGDSLRFGFGGGIFESPVFAQHCTNVTYNRTFDNGEVFYNVTEVCREDTGSYDLGDFYRRAPHQQRYAWSRDFMIAEDSGPGLTAVVFPLTVGEQYIFRLAPLYEPEAADIHGQRLLVPGPYSKYSSRVLIEISGPGAPIDLDCDDVLPNSIRLSWKAPPFNQSSGVWHGDGGLRLLGYRIFMRLGNESEAAATLIASTAETSFTLRDLPPQTLLRIYVLGENLQLRGLHSTTLSVATAALRATLWTDCNYTSRVHQPRAYQGCFREIDTSAATMDMQVAARQPGFSWSLGAEACASACEPAPFFGLRSGGQCLCGHTFGRYGAVEDEECDMPCTGEPERMCGGVNRTSIYRRPGLQGILLGAGKYFIYDLLRMRLPARSLSSVEVPEGLVLTMYTKDSLRGRSLNLTSNVPCLDRHACTLPEGALTWAEPPPRCHGDEWNDETASIELSYNIGPHPPYTPRPSAETGARAFALGTAGKLARLMDLGGDLTQSKSERPVGMISPYWRAPRKDDSDECAQRVGEFSSDRTCLQPAPLDIPGQRAKMRTSATRRLYEEHLLASQREDFTDEYARIKRSEWRVELHAYARQFYTRRLMDDGESNGDGTGGSAVSHRYEALQASSYDEWFDSWLDGIAHLVPMFYRNVDGGLPVLGMNLLGEPVAYEEATAAQMPLHPFPPAEDRGSGVMVRAKEREEAADREKRRAVVEDGAIIFGLSEATRGHQGPIHDRSEEYAPSKMQQRATRARNAALDEMEAASTAGGASNLGAGGRPTEELIAAMRDPGEALFTEFV